MGSVGEAEVYATGSDNLDRIEVVVGLLKSYYGRKVVDVVKQRRKGVDERVMQHAMNSPYIQSHPELIGQLKITSVEIHPDWSIIYTIEKK